MADIALLAKVVSAALVVFMLVRLLFRCLREGVPEVWDSLGVELDLRAFGLLLLGLVASGLAVLGVFAVEISLGQIRGAGGDRGYDSADVRLPGLGRRGDGDRGDRRDAYLSDLLMRSLERWLTPWKGKI
ncbi:MAG: hypothetical protein GY719_04995 [bacterium]|nr:hypothetical protein [bacterium]